MNTIAIVAYLALFVTVGLLFVFVNLFIGRFLRPHDPSPEKREIYECGEPTIGSSFVQFDLRFYVVALLFLIFDVEIAFFFPWATVFGKATHLQDPALHRVVAAQPVEPERMEAELQRAKLKELDRQAAISSIYNELGVPLEIRPDSTESEEITEKAKQLALFSFLDILVFFGVVLVGFAYVWMRGDIDWVRAVSQERVEQTARGPPET